MPKPRKPKVGDVGWFVKWVDQLAWLNDGPNNEPLSVDLDRCREQTRFAATREMAKQIAKEVWPQAKDCFGAVFYWSVEFVPYDEDDAMTIPHAGYWRETGDCEVYEGED